MADGKRVYLGDGVYAQYKGENLVLTTDNGVTVTNTIILEPETWYELVRFMAKPADLP